MNSIIMTLLLMIDDDFNDDGDDDYDREANYAFMSVIKAHAS